MADTVPITAGTGTTIATDDTGATGHIQLFKLAYSADGVATLVPATVNGLLAELSRFPAALTSVGSASAAGQSVSLAVDYGVTAVGVQVTGTWTGQLEFESTVDGTNYESHDLIRNSSDEVVNATASNGIFFAGVPAFQTFQVRASTLSSGTADITIRGSVGQESVHIESPLPGGVSLRTDSLFAQSTTLTPKFAKANIAASTTDGAVVAAVATKKIRVLQVAVQPGGSPTNVTFNSKPGGAGTAISSLWACPANAGPQRGFSPVGWFETVAGEGLSVTTGSGATVGIDVVYVEV